MITAIAVDDEPLALDVIKALCSRLDFVDLKRTFIETSAALRYLAEHPVDLVLLDINMPAMSGIDFSKLMSGKTMVIFTTAYSEYAVEGFNMNALDYLLKPFEYGRFQKAMEKAREQQQYLQHKESASSQHLFVKVDHSVTKIPFADILYIEGLDNYLKIHLVNGKTMLVRMSMKAAMEKLPADAFLRVHRSYIIPLNKVTTVKNKIVHLGSTAIPVGTNYVDEVRKLFRDL